MTPDSVFCHHTPSEKDIQQQKIQTLPLPTKNRSTKALSTKDSKYNYNSSTRKSVQPSEPWVYKHFVDPSNTTPASSPFCFGPQMLCILCGQSPIKLVGSAKPASMLLQPTHQPSPPNPPSSQSTYVGNSSTVIPLDQPQLSFGGRPFRAIVSSVQYPNCLVTLHQANRCTLLLSIHQKTAIPTPSSVPQTLDSIPQIIGPAYNSYRTARVASFDPYPTSQASQAAAKQSKAPALPKPPANKGVLRAINPPAEIAVPCGFEMWSNGGWTPKQKVRPVIDYMNWAYADAYTELQTELCEKFCGRLSLSPNPMRI
ncbi:hypothetical protein H4Q26_012604 [Puccinia striiformis f. sp. tritici PST-130]|nr:hypothetical protein H4Q26_012604 [Puccinia striiformis f. sp. tritici PST-130]